MTFDNDIWSHSLGYRVDPIARAESNQAHYQIGYPYFEALNTAAWLERRWTHGMYGGVPNSNKLGALMHRESIPRSRKDPCGSCAACLRRKKDWPDADWQGWELTCSS